MGCVLQVEVSLDESLIAQNRGRWTTLATELHDLELVNGKRLRAPAPPTSRPTSAAGRPGTAGGGPRPAMRPTSAVSQAKANLASHLDRQMDELMGVRQQLRHCFSTVLDHLGLSCADWWGRNSML